MFLCVNFNIEGCLISVQSTICLTLCKYGYSFKHQRMFDHCVDHHLPDHYASMIQLSKL